MEKMKKMKKLGTIRKEKKAEETELVFLLDRSGSMSGLEEDTIHGFNSMIRRHKKSKSKVYVSTVLFDHEALLLHDRREIRSLEKMTERDYFVRGSTALLDAVGRSILHMIDIQKKKKSASKVLFVITTDGMENASREFSRRQVKHLIERQQREYGWEFIFLGANIDSEETAAGIGISRERAVNYLCDRQGISLNFRAVSEAIASYAEEDAIRPSWREKIDRDYRSRGGSR